jgi:DNA-binding CsgD family transcriptional regulator
MSKTRGNRSSAAQIAARRKTELELLAQGESQTSIAKALNISRVTLWRDLLDIKKRFDTDLPEDFRKSLRAQVEKIKELIAIGRIADGRKVELLQRNVELEAKYGPKIDLNSGPGNTTNKTINIVYIGSDNDPYAAAAERQRIEAAKAEGERQRGVNDALTVEPSRILEGEVKP